MASKANCNAMNCELSKLLTKLPRHHNMCGSVQLPLMRQGCKTNAAIQILDPLQPICNQMRPKAPTKKKHRKLRLRRVGKGMNKQGMNTEFLKRLRERCPGGWGRGGMVPHGVVVPHGTSGYLTLTYSTSRYPIYV